jgi:alkylhydroperoxidase family enzyme
VPNLHRILAESPAAFEAYGTLWGIAEKTSFTAQERNIVYLAIIYENECTYCMAAPHQAVAHGKGGHLGDHRRARGPANR